MRKIHVEINELSELFLQGSNKKDAKYSAKVDGVLFSSDKANLGKNFFSSKEELVKAIRLAYGDLKPNLNPKLQLEILDRSKL